MDYGEINIKLTFGEKHWYEKSKIVNMQADNQLFTDNSIHRAEIISNCMYLASILREGIEFSKTFTTTQYSYTFNLSYGKTIF